MKLERNDWFFLVILVLFTVPSFLMDITTDPNKAITNLISVVIMAFVLIFVVKVAWPWVSKKMDPFGFQPDEDQPTELGE